MKRILTRVLLLALLPVLVGCSAPKKEDTAPPASNPAPVIQPAKELIGDWTVVTGSDQHTVKILEGGSLSISDGEEVFTVVYTAETERCLAFRMDGTDYKLKYENGILIRLEDGAEDGYTYRRITADEKPEEGQPQEESVLLNNGFYGQWETATGGDAHSMNILEGGTALLTDGGEQIQTTYTVVNTNTIALNPDDFDWILRLDGETLIRLKDGAEDGYTYRRTTSDTSDYNYLCGSYAEGNEESGPLYIFELIAAADGWATFRISSAGFNFSPYYFTESITAPLRDGRYDFEWSDSWGNKGNGSFTLHDEETPCVRLKMEITEEAEWNRGTLATNGTKELKLQPKG